MGVEIRRKYVQGGKEIETPKLDVNGKEYNSISTGFCSDQKKETGDKDEFGIRGGLKQMGKALGRGMVLVMSVWDDTAAHMLWLDSTYPVGASGPGAERGPCAASTGEPGATRTQYPNSQVQYKNIKFGTIGSTTKNLPPSPPSPPSPSPSGCPGGSLEACIGLCPSDPTAFQACVTACQQRCKSEIVV